MYNFCQLYFDKAGNKYEFKMFLIKLKKKFLFLKVRIKTCIFLKPHI